MIDDRIRYNKSKLLNHQTEIKISSMKKTLHLVFTILIFAVLLGRMLGWVLHLNEEADKILNMGMFTLIGIAYLVMGFVWDNKLLQFIILICGVFLIGMNFLENNTILNIMGIVCILTPMIIARFDKKVEQ